MKVLSDSLKKTAGGKLESLLKKATDNPIKGLGIGALITVAIQSSSAMTVMLVGFVNSGIMELAQTVGVIFGSDIGTTLTAWILSLSGIDGGDVFILKVLKPSCFCLIFALIGVLLLMASKKQKNKDIGTMLLGFAILMQGMTMMSESMAPLKDMESFTDLLTAFNNPLLGILAGAVVTGIIQSSAASIGILQSLSLTGQLSYSVAIPLVLGANIGTCATAVLSSIGVSRDAKRVTAIHVEIKVIGVIIWLIAYCLLSYVFHVPLMDEKIGVVGIAMVHSIFNISNSIILMPFRNVLVKISRIFIKEKDEEKEFVLDERLMLTPPLAVAECRNSMKKMISKAKSGLDISTLMLLNGYNDADFETIKKNEESIDKFEDRIGTYLMKLTTTQHLSVQDKNNSSRMLQAVGEIERIADHANYLSNSSEELFEKKIEFSAEAKAELIRIVHAVRKVYTLAIDCFLSEDAKGAKDIGPLRIVINEMSDEFKANHVERLASGQCTTEQGFVFNDILYSCVRIAEHSLNIAAIAYRFKNPSKENYTTYMHDFKQLKDSVSERRYKEFLDEFSSVEKACGEAV
ncbi:MAG: Na/Pi cotransporter family protein, partial [Clostridiales bacterium]|nr:Na/Pi cotransporter family protein [Clostridiales bacterium]